MRALDGANTIFRMKHKHRYVVPAKDTRMGGAITVAIKYCCDFFQLYRFIKCVREWEAAKDQESF